MGECLRENPRGLGRWKKTFSGIFLRRNTVEKQPPFFVEKAVRAKIRGEIFRAKSGPPNEKATCGGATQTQLLFGGESTKRKKLLRARSTNTPPTKYFFFL